MEKFKSNKGFETTDTTSTNSQFKINFNDFYHLNDKSKSKGTNNKIKNTINTLNSLCLSLSNNFNNFISHFQRKNFELLGNLFNLFGTMKNHLDVFLFKNLMENNNILNPNLFQENVQNDYGGKISHEKIEKLNSISSVNLSYFQTLNNNIVSTKKIK